MKRRREQKPLHPALVSVSGTALIKHLASCNTTIRYQSLRLLQSFLASQSAELSDSDINKLWKGLFYCLWHADKTPNQVALIDGFTFMFQSLRPSLALEFFRGFLVTVRREWSGIDKLRLDKFYLLIRRFVRALFELMRLRNWNIVELRSYFGVLESDGLLADDKLQGNGVNYHLVSVFLEELKAVGFPVRKEVVDVIFGPLLGVMMKCKDKILLGKVKSSVFDELVRLGKGILIKKGLGDDCDDCDEKDGDLLLGVVALRMGLGGRFYEVGSSVDCIQGNRKVIFGLNDEFLKLEKDLELSGFEIAIPEYSNVCIEVDYDDIPPLIPINNGEETWADGGEGLWDVDDEDKRIFKKSKKVKKDKDGDDMKREKKTKTKRKDENGVLEVTSAIADIGDLVRTNGTDNLGSPSGSENCLSDELKIDETATAALSETVISNLQRQFAEAAAKMEGVDGQDAGISKINGTEDGDEVDAVAKSVEKPVKKVRFSMKHNLVWTPPNPLPPESLRLPSSVTPRGSALKKGVRPGPIIEAPSVSKKSKRKRKAQNRAKQRKRIKTRTA